MLKSKQIRDGVYWVGAADWNRRLFDALVPLPDGTSYNAYLVIGSEKTALIDSVDPAMSGVLLTHLEGVERIDYIVSHHAEQDHSGAIPAVLEKYPEAKVVTNEKARALLSTHLPISDDRFMIIKEGDTLDLGGKTLEFISTPWVHWPETFVSYLKEDRILFTCDLFGSHLATPELYSSKSEKVCEAVKRYYAEVMMPFRKIIRKNLEKISEYEIDIIAPSHGPVHNEPKVVMAQHREWVSDELKNIVVLPYVSMHGSTERMVDFLTEALTEEGIRVERFDLTVTDLGSFAISLVDAATLIVATPSFLTGAHPTVVSAAFLANALKPKLRYGAVIGSFGWGTRLVDQCTDLLKGLKLDYAEPVLIKGEPRDEAFAALSALAKDIKAKHDEAGII
ncbi:MAG: FprA family A-type flavoprotein [Thermodesulfobacteriota bacterium]